MYRKVSCLFFLFFLRFCGFVGCRRTRCVVSVREQWRVASASYHRMRDAARACSTPCTRRVYRIVVHVHKSCDVTDGCIATDPVFVSMGRSPVKRFTCVSQQTRTNRTRVRIPHSQHKGSQTRNLPVSSLKHVHHLLYKSLACPTPRYPAPHIHKRSTGTPCQARPISFPQTAGPHISNAAQKPHTISSSRNPPSRRPHPRGAHIGTPRRPQQHRCTHPRTRGTATRPPPPPPLSKSRRGPCRVSSNFTNLGEITPCNFL